MIDDLTMSLRTIGGHEFVSGVNRWNSFPLSKRTWGVASTEFSSRHSSREIASNLPKECRDFTRSRNTKTYNTRGSGGRMIADIETIAKASQYCHFLCEKRG